MAFALMPRLSATIKAIGVKRIMVAALDIKFVIGVIIKKMRRIIKIGLLMLPKTFKAASAIRSAAPELVIAVATGTIAA